VATLPFDFYFGYVIEHRFGFSNLDVAGWVKLQAKGFAVSFPLTVLVGVAAYALLRAFPRAWVLLVPAGALGLQLVMTVLFPLLILPLFFKVQPVTDPALLGPLREVCAKAGVELQEVKLIDASRYSSKTNAFFTGFGRHKSIYLFDTLVNKHTPEETAAILAHELGHWRHNHVAKGIALSTGGLLLACALLAWLFPLLDSTPYLHTRGLADVASLPVLVLLASIAGFFMSPVTSGVSRYFERQADTACLELTGEREVYISDFRKLAEENRSNLLPHPVVVWWRFSHPPIVERIERVEADQ
jgi:STE24 endopeptidase